MCFGNELRLGVLLDKARVQFAGFLRLSESFVTLAGLEQRGRLPARVRIEDFDAEVFAESRVVSFLKQIRLADHPLSHCGGFGFLAVR